MAAARFTWILLGGLNAALVVLILRKISLTAAVSGGLFYAAYFPAIYSEHLTLLEALGTAGVLLTLLVGNLADAADRSSVARVVTAGLVAGAAASVKVWGVIPVLVIVVWLLIRVGWRCSLLFLGAGVAGCSLVCLPFFLSAPRAMWQMVVDDELGELANPSVELTRKLYDLVGLRGSPCRSAGFLLDPAAHQRFAGGGRLGLADAGGSSSRCPRRRSSTLLALTSIWWVHYASFIAGPAALR